MHGQQNIKKRKKKISSIFLAECNSSPWYKPMCRYSNGDISCEKNKWDKLATASGQEENGVKRETPDEELAVGIGQLDAKVVHEMG